MEVGVIDAVQPRLPSYINPMVKPYASPPKGCLESPPTQMQFVRINIINQNSLNTKEIIWSFYRPSRNIRDKDKQLILAKLKY